MTRPQPAPSPGAVEVRLSGEMEDVVRVNEMLTQTGIEVLSTRGPRPNRYDPGVRVYLLLRVDSGGGAR